MDCRVSWIGSWDGRPELFEQCCGNWTERTGNRDEPLCYARTSAAVLDRITYMAGKIELSSQASMILSLRLCSPCCSSIARAALACKKCNRKDSENRDQSQMSQSMRTFTVAETIAWASETRFCFGAMASEHC